MQINVVENQGAAVIRPMGQRMDLQVAGEFRAAMLELIQVGGHTKLVVDLEDVNFIDSSGLGALVTALKTVKLRNTDGDVRLANVAPPVVALLEIIRLHRVFSSYPSVDLAAQSFS